ncbi:MAG: metallophosphoesterase [Bacteroidetes bacterium]|nr:MAG: metallophosphoesterase [Bacteroidota bacterium]
MEIICISDTHGLHREISLPPGDILLHAGDVSMGGKEKEIIPFLEWFAKQDYRHKIFISGNHDFFFEKESPEKIRSLIPPGVIYLNDSGIEIEGVRIWGSPIQPWFMDWAFNRQRGAEIKKHWDLIPDNTDILVTHGPPAGMLDQVYTGLPVGCEDLMETVGRIKPKLHLFGHIHEAYGTIRQDDTLFVNASVLNRHYQPANEAITFVWK